MLSKKSNAETMNSNDTSSLMGLSNIAVVFQCLEAYVNLYKMYICL